MEEKSISLVIGGYNESAILLKNLETVYAAMDRAFKKWELILVDDASTDNTLSIMEQFAKRHGNNVSVLRNYVNLNFGTAVLRGMYAAKYDYVTFNACDLPLAIEDLSVVLDDTDKQTDVIVFERRRYKTTKWRAVTSGINGLLLKLLFPRLTRGTPTLNFVQIYRRDVLPKILPLARSPIFVWPEMIFRAKIAGFNIKNIPVNCQVKQVRSGAFGHPHDILWGLYEMIRFRVRLWGGNL